MRCLLAVKGLARASTLASSGHSQRIGDVSRGYIRSGPSLAALTLKAANPFLMPLLPHLRVGIRKCSRVDEVKLRSRSKLCRFKRTNGLA